METIKELIDSIRINVLNRVTNPLIGSFAIAWAVWNFRIILVVFSEGDWKTKIDYIDKTLMQTWQDWILHGYLAPLSVALAWVLISPILFRRMMVYHREQLAKTAAAVMVADDKQPIGTEEANRLRVKIRELSGQWETEKAEYLKQNEELSERIANLQKQTLLGNASKNDSIDQQVATQDTLPDVDDSEIDPLVDLIGNFKTTNKGQAVWPLPLGDADLEQLSSGLAQKIRGHRFQQAEIQALLAMRNWKWIDHAKLSRTLKIEPFDAQVIVDQLQGLDLVSRGPDGLYMNADGRLLTSFFKRTFSAPPKKA